MQGVGVPDEMSSQDAKSVPPWSRASPKEGMEYNTTGGKNNTGRVGWVDVQDKRSIFLDFRDSFGIGR